MKRKQKILTRIIAVVLVVVLAVVGSRLTWELEMQKQALSAYHVLAESYKTDETPEVPKETGDIVPDHIKAISIDWEGLEAQNPDYAAWLIWEDAGVDLPVMYDSDDSGFYLHHLFDGSYNYAGALMLNHGCKRDFTSRASYIYGHNMSNGTMLGYMNDLYWDPDNKITDPHFYLNVKGEWKGYAIFAMESIPKDSDLFRIPGGDDEYDAYINEILSQAVLNFSDREEVQSLLSRRCPVVALSTCDGGEGAANRLMTFAVETKAE